MPAIHANLDFLRSRIYEIKSALFSDIENVDFKIPTCIITVLKLDMKGNLWFLMNQPECHLDCYEMQFPALLSFYRKGICFSLSVHGRATIILNADTIENMTGEHRSSMGNIVLVKMSMLKIKYSEWKLKSSHADFWGKFVPGILNLFYSSGFEYNQREFSAG